jgi:pimeloyl-ACP methyl ester carboxylesterase
MRSHLRLDSHTVKTQVCSNLIEEDLYFEHRHWGKIFVRNKRPVNVDSFASNKIVVLQHGATYGSAAFYIMAGGTSLMDYLAARGFDTYCLDLPGYGFSERPPQMSKPAEANQPFMRTPEAAECLGFVCEHIRNRRGVEKLCLIGHSWGTAIAAFYINSNHNSVERLVLFAPVWHRTGGEKSPVRMDGPLGAYRTVSRAATLARRQEGLSEEQKHSIMPTEWFDLWWETVAASDPDLGGEAIRAPNGVVADAHEYWENHKPLYDPTRIQVPSLITVGELDRDTPPYMAQTLFPLLTKAPWKRLSILSGGTHTILMESHRMLLFRTVQQFLDEPEPGMEKLE